MQPAGFVACLVVGTYLISVPSMAAEMLHPPRDTYDLHLVFGSKPRCGDFALLGMDPTPGRSCPEVELVDVLGNVSKGWRVDFTSLTHTFPNTVTLEGLVPAGPASKNPLLFAYWTDKNHKETSRLMFPVPMADGAPEPAVWAMLLLGFGAVGVRLRRRPAHLA